MMIGAKVDATRYLRKPEERRETVPDDNFDHSLKNPGNNTVMNKKQVIILKCNARFLNNPDSHSGTDSLTQPPYFQQRGSKPPR